LLTYSVEQEYAKGHCRIIDAVARSDLLLQISWYACTPASSDDRAMIALACTLDKGCLRMRVDGGGFFYEDAFLISPGQAAGHISIELCDHVLQNVVFLACISPIMQVPSDERRVACDV
jgi:hypothetical protein